VYAGHDGNVYRRQDGGWQKYENGSWGSVNTPQPRTGDRAAAGTGTAGTADRTRTAPSSINTDTYGQLERDRAARTEGTTRTRDYSTTRSSGGSSRSTGSYRPRSSGGMRAGGGRRR
jgi:hypothetical protein